MKGEIEIETRDRDREGKEVRSWRGWLRTDGAAAGWTRIGGIGRLVGLEGAALWLLCLFPNFSN